LFGLETLAIIAILSRRFAPGVGDTSLTFMR
jgi:hypothetical protein